MNLSADEFIRDHKLPAERGFVMFHEGRPFAWALNPDARHWCPGVVAMRLRDRALLVASGGSQHYGARVWCALPTR